jgi:hypothetical protein
MQSLVVEHDAYCQWPVSPAHDLTAVHRDPLKMSTPLEVGWCLLLVLGVTVATQKAELAHASPVIPGDAAGGDPIVAQVRPLYRQTEP